jgi:hypothetical protein
MSKLLQGLCLQVNVIKNDGGYEDFNSFSSTEETAIQSAELVSANESSYNEGDIIE